MWSNQKTRCQEEDGERTKRKAVGPVPTVRTRSESRDGKHQSFPKMHRTLFFFLNRKVETETGKALSVSSHSTLWRCVD